MEPPATNDVCFSNGMEKRLHNDSIGLLTTLLSIAICSLVL